MTKTIKATALLLVCSTAVPAAVVADEFSSGMLAYEQGDYVNAQQAFSAAAAAGDADAQYMLGRLFASGNGAPQDFVQAYRWYNLAAAQGQRFAGPARDSLAAQMTAEQIAAAQELSRAGQSPADSAATAPEVKPNAPAADAAQDAIDQQLSETTITQIQLNLKRLGYDVGAINGQLSEQTRAAIRAYQSEFQLDVDGLASEDLLNHLAANGGNQPTIKRGSGSGTGIEQQQNVDWRRLL